MVPAQATAEVNVAVYPAMQRALTGPLRFVKAQTAEQEKSMANYIRIGSHEIEVSSQHIYLQPQLPKTYDYVLWNLISEVLEENLMRHAALIDIGANVGDTLAHFRRHSVAPALCVEPDSCFFGLLQKNAAQFRDVELRNALLVPEHLVGKAAFSADSQTGFSRPARDGEVAWQGQYTTFSEIVDFSNSPLIVKTDTDGFDAEIIRSLVPHLGRRFIPVLLFEGPDERQVQDNDYSEFLLACSSLQRIGYKILLMTNVGLPYAYVGSSIKHLTSCLTALTIGRRKGSALCHYFDALALHPSMNSNLHSLQTPWPDKVFITA